MNETTQEEGSKFTPRTRVHKSYLYPRQTKKQVEAFKRFKGRRPTAAESNALNFLSHPMRREKA